MAANNRTPSNITDSVTAELATIFDPNAGRAFYSFVPSKPGDPPRDPSKAATLGDGLATLVMNASEGGTTVGDLLKQSLFDGAKTADVSAAKLLINFIVPASAGVENANAKQLCATKTIDDVFGKSTGTTGTKYDPRIASVIFRASHLNFSERDTGAVSIFMNSIPTIEFSRCQAYLDLQIITPGASLSGKDGKSGKPQGISLFKFLQGNKEVAENSGDAKFVSANPVEAVAFQTSKQQTLTDQEPSPYSYAGMEVFTSPQTLVPAGETYTDYASMAESYSANPNLTTGKNIPGLPGSSRSAPIIDRMRPFMTLKSFDVTVQPTKGTMSTKEGKLSLTLHDRSRLGEIADLVKPASLGKTEILVEWGWSHPDGITGNNPIGAFLNSLRVREKYGVYNSSYSFTDDGQVEVNLDMVTKGVDNVNWTDVASSKETREAWKDIEKIIQNMREFRVQVLKDEDMKDVAGMSAIASISPSNVADVFSGEQSQEIDKFLEQWKGAKNVTPQIQNLVTTLDDLNKKVDAQTKSLSQTIQEKYSVLKNKIDPYFTEPDGTTLLFDPACIGVSSLSQVQSGYVSFGKLMQVFVAEPLAATGNFDEVQMMFYCFNDKAGWFGVSDKLGPKPISCFPIPTTSVPNKSFEQLFKKELQKYVQFPVARFVNWCNATFLASMATPAYGFSSNYTYDENGKTQVKEAKNDKNQPATLKSAKDKVLAQAYYGITDLTKLEGREIIFKMPKITMFMEVVPVNASTNTTTESASQKTILRIHFIDENAGKYSGLGQILSQAKSSNMGMMAKTSTGQNKSEQEIRAAMQQQGLLQDAGNYLRIVGGPPAIKHFVKSNMPSITYGTISSAVTNASAQSMNDSKDATIHMLRAQKTATDSNVNPSEQDRGLPMRMMPFDISIDTLGCPLLNHMQQFFVDFGTNTTIDNVYAVCGVSHKLELGSFTTSAKLIPIADAYGTYESTISVVEKALGLAKS